MYILQTLRRKLAGARSGVLTPMRSALAAIVLIAPLAGGSAYGAVKTAAPASATTAVAAGSMAAATFDGHALYEKAFEALRDNHYTLVNPAARAAFAAQWQHKHDQDSALFSEKGTDMAIYEMMWSLGQRFDYYFPPEETRAEHAEEQATMAGIGVSLGERGLFKAVKALGATPTRAQVEPLLKFSADRPLVVEEDADSDTPAGKAHIVRGDRIIAVDGQAVYGKSIEQIVTLLHGPVGTKVVLKIDHDDVGGRVIRSDRSLTRATITVHAVKTDYEGRIAHIHLSNFDSQFGPREMAYALAEANDRAAGIILDLRDNPGGIVGEGLEMAQMFIGQGVILKTVERDGDHMVTVTYSVTADKFVTTTQSDDGSPPQVEQQNRLPLLVDSNVPVVVLINEGSASCSEILAGTLQANGRARVMGEPSRGKGVGQLVVPLSTDHSMHVTSFEFFPGGIKMDWVGIVPDIEVKLPADADLLDDPSSDSQLNAARLELIDTAVGNPTAPLPQAQIDTRRAQLEKEHRAAFQQEVLERQAALQQAASDAAKAH